MSSAAILNAVALGRDPDFRDWVRAATCYHARTALTGGTPAGRKLALVTVTSPTVHLDQWINVLSADPALCETASAVGDDEGQIGQTLLLTQIAATWSALAAALYPEA